jgi:hypothetical protein
MAHNVRAFGPSPDLMSAAGGLVEDESSGYGGGWFFSLDEKESQ